MFKHFFLQKGFINEGFKREGSKGVSFAETVGSLYIIGKNLNKKPNL